MSSTIGDENTYCWRNLLGVIKFRSHTVSQQECVLTIEIAASIAPYTTTRLFSELGNLHAKVNYVKLLTTTATVISSFGFVRTIFILNNK